MPKLKEVWLRLAEATVVGLSETSVESLLQALGDLATSLYPRRPAGAGGEARRAEPPVLAGFAQPALRDDGRRRRLVWVRTSRRSQAGRPLPAPKRFAQDDLVSAISCRLAGRHSASASPCAAWRAASLLSREASSSGRPSARSRSVTESTTVTSPPGRVIRASPAATSLSSMPSTPASSDPRESGSSPRRPCHRAPVAAPRRGPPPGGRLRASDAGCDARQRPLPADERRLRWRACRDCRQQWLPRSGRHRHRGPRPRADSDSRGIRVSRGRGLRACDR
jgi:hypothetical protein